jgi:hypothetical protein
MEMLVEFFWKLVKDYSEARGRLVLTGATPVLDGKNFCGDALA